MSIDELITPCYLIDIEKLEMDMCSFVTTAKKIHPNTIVSYSFKTNYYSVILESAKRAGMWAEVVSEEEYLIAKKEGYDTHMVYNGPIKSYRTFMDALNKNQIVNIDSEVELRWLEDLDSNRNYKIGIRINYSLTDYGIENETISRFGFDSDNLENIIKRINTLSNVKLVGFHMHKSGNSRSVEVYKSITRAGLDIARKYNVKLEYLDVGGGFKLGVSDDMTTEKYMRGIKSVLREYKEEEICIVLEPGNSLVYPSVDYVANVVDLKTVKGQNFATLDGSRIHIDPLFRRTQYLGIDIIRRNEQKGNLLDSLFLCGFTCKETDRMAILENVMISQGDLVIFRKIGAYTMSLVPPFIQGFPRIYTKKDNEIMLQEDNKMI